MNELAPEHVHLVVDQPEKLLEGIRNAGAVFLGPWSAVPFGDYGLASNHVLPTAGTARFASGLRASDYVTVSSVVQVAPEGVARHAAGTAAIANAEGLVGHAKAITTRAHRVGG